MSDILKNPVFVSLLIGGSTFAVMSRLNTQPIDKKKRKPRPKSLFGDPKEVNVLVSILVTLLTWYYLYSRQKNDVQSNVYNQDGLIDSVTASSEERKSYNLLGSGLQLPNGQQLPDIFHKIV